MPKLLKLVLYLNFCLCMGYELDFDVSLMDYCKLTCKDGSMPAACYCTRFHYKEDIFENTELKMGKEHFRQTVLDIHNDLRNRQARGEDKDKNFPEVANMRALHYDMELEYIAWCFLISNKSALNREDGKEKCRAVSFCSYEYQPLQNVFFTNDKTYATKEGLEKIIVGWFSQKESIQYDDRPNAATKLTKEHLNVAEKYVKMAWALTDRVGCAWVENPMCNITGCFKYLFCCNYASEEEMCGVSIPGQPMFKPGPKCSQCDEDMKCNIDIEGPYGGKYDALCGEAKIPVLSCYFHRKCPPKVKKIIVTRKPKTTTPKVVRKTTKTETKATPPPPATAIATTALTTTTETTTTTTATAVTIITVITEPPQDGYEGMDRYKTMKCSYRSRPGLFYKKHYDIIMASRNAAVVDSFIIFLCLVIVAHIFT